MNKRDQIRMGDRVRITAQGITVTGITSYVDLDGDYWMIELTDEQTGLSHYWKQRSDGGSVQKL